jgi:hypothetical protein
VRERRETKGKKIIRAQIADRGCPRQSVADRALIKRDNLHKIQDSLVLTTDIVAISVAFLLFGCRIAGGRDDMKETKQYVQNIP